MNVQRALSNPKLTGVSQAQKPEGLEAIHRPDCAAAIWQRQSLPSFQDWIDGVAPENLPQGRFITTRDKVHDAASQLCDIYETPAGSERARFVDDVSALAHIFTELLDLSALRVRLDLVSSNSCRKFHIDMVTARLICTYRGTGTQYRLDQDGAETTIGTVPTGSPVILRGTLWPNLSDGTLLHRSPPIEGTGETRLLLVLDPAEDWDTVPDHLKC